MKIYHHGQLTFFIFLVFLILDFKLVGNLFCGGVHTNNYVVIVAKNDDDNFNHYSKFVKKKTSYFTISALKGNCSCFCFFYLIFPNFLEFNLFDTSQKQ